MKSMLINIKQISPHVYIKNNQLKSFLARKETYGRHPNIYLNFDLAFVRTNPVSNHSRQLWTPILLNFAIFFKNFNRGLKFKP